MKNLEKVIEKSECKLATIEKSGGKFLTVTFVKKDGTVRTLNGRLGVKKGLVGGKSNVDHNKYINIYDVQAHGYRNVNKETIIQVKFGGEIYK
jgi:hypothetical protein